MKDLAGKELKLDDRVVFNGPCTGLIIGKVVGFTPKMVKVEYLVVFTGETAVVNEFPHRLAKVE